MNAALKEVLQTIHCEEMNASIVDAGLVKQCDLNDSLAVVRLVYGFAAKSQHAAMRQKITTALRQVEGVREVRVDIDTQIVAHAAQLGVERIGQVRNILAVASGKGGVGKSTTTVNLALALAAEGARVGVLDADIYGPSIPTMLGISGRPESEDGKSIEPKEGHGLQASSIGFLIDKDEAMIWRGPMVTQALEQLLRQTKWRDLDYLLIDLPPGTGDIHLTLSQRVPITGAVIVTTPQEVALMDARKGLRMFEKTWRYTPVPIAVTLSTFLAQVARRLWQPISRCRSWAVCRWICGFAETQMTDARRWCLILTARSAACMPPWRANCRYRLPNWART